MVVWDEVDEPACCEEIKEQSGKPSVHEPVFA